MSRLTLSDTTSSAITKMSEGNPGTITALSEIFKHTSRIDPQLRIGAMGVLLSLDTYEIYGTEIYILYNDKCDRDIRRFLMLLRTVQLGLFNRTKLKTMAEDQARQINLTEKEWTDLDEGVCKKLTDFARDTE